MHSEAAAEAEGGSWAGAAEVGGAHRGAAAEAEGGVERQGLAAEEGSGPAQTEWAHTASAAHRGKRTAPL